jgi:hypothetical protein
LETDAKLDPYAAFWYGTSCGLMDLTINVVCFLRKDPKTIVLPPPKERFVPTVQLSKDQEWLGFLESMGSDVKAEAERVLDEQRQSRQAAIEIQRQKPVLESNKKDTPKQQEQYRSVARWTQPADAKLHKPTTHYFFEQVMIPWRFKTSGLVDDSGLHDLDLRDAEMRLIKYKLPTVFRAALEYKEPDKPQRIETEGTLSRWFEEGKMEDIKRALIYSVAFLADLCVRVYEYALSLSFCCSLSLFPLTYVDIECI